MKEERIEILKMLHEGLISVEDAEKLLSALNSGKDKTEKQYNKHNANPFDGSFFGEGLINEIDKGLSGIGKVFEGVFGHSGDQHFPGYESVFTTDGLITVESGDILEIRQQTDRRLNGSCDIELRASSGKNIEVETSSEGNFEVKRKEHKILILCFDDCEISIPAELLEVTVKLLNGDMEISDIQCTVDAETLNGDINIENCPAPGNIKSLSGDIEMTVPENYQGKSTISTLSGDVQLSLSDSFSGIIDAKAMSGEIACDIESGINIKKESTMVHEKQIIEINEASRENIINCSTLSGDIQIESA